LNVNQWRNTQTVIEWFGNIKENTCRHTFISFDIDDFYASISEHLLDQTLSWASNLTDISVGEISIIKHLGNLCFSIMENRGSKEIAIAPPVQIGLIELDRCIRR
jgi:hypothetical protein